jgi:hypothetical protein
VIHEVEEKLVQVREEQRTEKKHTEQEIETIKTEFKLVCR